MPQVVKPISNRTYVIEAKDHGLILTLGPAATSSDVGTFVIQFNPDASSDFEVVVMGRCWGVAAQSLQVPFLPIPYRRCTIANAASDYAIVSDPVSSASLLQVPANWEIGLLVSCTTGSCGVASWPLQGNSNP